MLHSPATINSVVKHAETIKGMCSYNCPRPGCSASFTAVNGCAATSCPTCNAGVCQWCLVFCGEGRQAAYNHVPGCGYNRRRGTQEAASISEMNAVRDIVIKARIEDYIRTKVDIKLQSLVLERLQRDPIFQKRGIVIVV